jgi:putative transposase
LKATPYTKAAWQGGFSTLQNMSAHKRTIRTLSHCFYDLKYHLVWTPKYRGKVLTSDKIKNELRRIFESICKWKHWEIIELSIQDDHIHCCLLLTPRDSVSYAMQILKRKSSAWMKKKIKRTHGLYERQSLWARGYFVSTIGLDENLIRRYVKHQHHHNEIDQPSLFEKLIN